MKNGKLNLFFLFTILLFFIQCNSDFGNLAEQKAELEEIKAPEGEGGEPNLFIAKSGEVFLSWIAYENDSTDVLKISKLVNNDTDWEAPKVVASGSDWFVNWADFPSVAQYNDNPDHLVAHWLQTSELGTYDYDVKISQSKDGGQNWSAPSILHDDGINAEHGFATLLPLGNGQMFATWLDGRNTKTKTDGVRGAMTIRGAIFNVDGNKIEDVELDNRVCDCCQTDAAVTSNGIIVAYRDRSEGEVRDISVVRKVDGEWLPPSILHPDNWLINGCPVNGPAIASDGTNVAIAWFASPEANSAVKITFSENAGADFEAPFTVDADSVIGRVDVIWVEPGKALVTWMGKSGDQGTVKAALFTKAGKVGENFDLVPTSAARKSGFPIIEKSKDDIILAWTEVDGAKTRIKTAKVKL